MSGLNRHDIIGNLGQDPETRYTASGDPVVNITVATSEKYKGEEHTTWHRVVIFGKLAEVAGQYLTKGSKVYISGRVQHRKYQDSQGNDKYSTEIVTRDLVMLGGRPTPGPGENSPENANPAASGGNSDDGFDDIPF